MKEPKISVIIPVYNTEKYLQQCLTSLINQTYRKLEIICVNDGSTDRCSDILEYSSKIDERIKVINQENQGFTSARNAGLNAASGEWIAFLDSDDWLGAECYAKFVEVLNNSEVSAFDIYMFNGVCFTEDISDPKKIALEEFFTKEHWNNKNNEICSYKDCKNPFQGNLAVYNKIYRKSFLEENNFKFKNSIHDDERFWIQAIAKAKGVYITDTVFYHYRQRPGSLMHNSKSNLYDMFQTYNEIREFLIQNNLFEISKYALLQYKYNQYAWGFFTIEDIHKEDFFEKAKADLSKEMKTGYSPNILDKLKNNGLLKGFLTLNSKEFYYKFGKYAVSAV